MPLVRVVTACPLPVGRAASATLLLQGATRRVAASSGRRALLGWGGGGGQGGPSSRFAWALRPRAWDCRKVASLPCRAGGYGRAGDPFASATLDAGWYYSPCLTYSRVATPTRAVLPMLSRPLTPGFPARQRHPSPPTAAPADGCTLCLAADGCRTCPSQNGPRQGRLPYPRRSPALSTGVRRGERRLPLLLVEPPWLFR